MSLIPSFISITLLGALVFGFFHVTALHRLSFFLLLLCHHKYYYFLILLDVELVFTVDNREYTETVESKFRFRYVSSNKQFVKQFGHYQHITINIIIIIIYFANLVSLSTLLILPLDFFCLFTTALR